MRPAVAGVVRPAVGVVHARTLIPPLPPLLFRLLPTLRLPMLPLHPLPPLLLRPPPLPRNPLASRAVAKQRRSPTQQPTFQSGSFIPHSLTHSLTARACLSFSVLLSLTAGASNTFVKWG